MYIGYVCTYTCHIWIHWNQPFNKMHCTHIWHISLNKYSSHIPNVAEITNYFMVKYTQHFCIYMPNHIQLQILLYMLLPNMCQENIRHAYMGGCMCIHVPHIKHMHYRYTYTQTDGDCYRLKLVSQISQKQQIRVKFLEKCQQNT